MKEKISISLDHDLLARLKAVMEYEKRPSVTNAIESTIDLSKYDFADVTIDWRLGRKYKVI